MAVCPQPFTLTPRSQIGHRLGGQSNRIMIMPSFATACHIHKVGLQIYLRALGLPNVTGIPYSPTLCFVRVLIELP